MALRLIASAARAVAGIGARVRARAPSRFESTATPTPTPTIQQKLMQFFDDEKNWGKFEIRVGRSWRIEELRIKSNEDLHKLWYVLLKERNMLLTMEHECEQNVKLFPNPERIDKVEESMSNLESVVRERNRAYHRLETGETGERGSRKSRSRIGLTYKYRLVEHALPRNMNGTYTRCKLYRMGAAEKKFIRLYREKLYNRKRKQRNKDIRHVEQLFKRFPNMSIEALKADYPHIDNIEKYKYSQRARGSFVPKEFE